MKNYSLKIESVPQGREVYSILSYGKNFEITGKESWAGKKLITLEVVEGREKSLEAIMGLGFTRISKVVLFRKNATGLFVGSFSSLVSYLNTVLFKLH